MAQHGSNLSNSSDSDDNDEQPVQSTYMGMYKENHRAGDKRTAATGQSTRAFQKVSEIKMTCNCSECMTQAYHSLLDQRR